MAAKGKYGEAFSSSSRVNEIESLLRVSINSDIKPFISIVSPQKGSKWTDSINAQIDRRNQGFIQSQGLIEEHIHKKLGHITVNPQKVANTNALINVYAYAGGGQNHINEYVNNDEKAVNELMVGLIKKAREKHKDFISRDGVTDDYSLDKNHGDNFSILSGERGVGKTFFLNHVLSKYSELMDKEKVIWVRLNLVEDFGGNDDLLHWIYAQSAKIILRYYDNQSKYCDKGSIKSLMDVMEHLDKWSQKQAESIRGEYLRNLVALRQVFTDQLVDEPITPDLIPKDIGREIFSYATQVGYAFIVVFDGFDRLEITEGASNKFQHLHKALQKMAAADQKMAATFLLVCRTETKNLLSEAISKPFYRGQPNTLLLGNPNLLDIIFKRLEYLKKEIHNQSKSRSIHQDGFDSDSHIEGFENFLKANNIGDYLSFMGGNLRASMQAIQFAYLDYLKEQEGRTSYLITESLMKMGHYYPPRPYTYTRDKNNYRHIVQNATVDHRLLPSIFHFPYFDWSESENEPPQIESVLLGLRITQLAFSYEDLRQKKKCNSSLKAFELIELASKLFNYPEQATSSLIAEFGEFECFRLSGPHYPITEVENYDVLILPKLRHIYNELLWDIGYLTLCSMRCPFSISALGEEPFITAATSNDSSRSKYFERWVIAKILNPVNFYRYLKLINTSQEKNYLDNVKNLSSDRLKSIATNAKDLKMFEFSPEADSIVTQAIAVAESFIYSQPLLLEKIDKAIKTNIRNWVNVRP